MLDLILDTLPSLPPHQSTFGAVALEWEEVGPGLVQIRTSNANVDTRHLAYTVLASDLADCGYLIDQIEIPDFHTKVATWADVMQAAQRLYQNGSVRLIRNGYNIVVAQVQGEDPSTQVDVEDHKRVRPPPPHPQQTYMVEFSRDDPDSQVLTQRSCTCKWFQFNVGTQPKREQFESRVCKHILAAYWKSRSTPLDEDIHPATQFGEAPQQQIPMMPPSAPGTATYPQESVPNSPQDYGRTLQQTGPFPPQPSQQPPFISPQPTLIPMQAQDFAQQEQEWNQAWKDYIQNSPISVPKQQGPYPGDPTSSPGTLSHVVKAQGENLFQQGDTVRINVPTYAQKEGVEGAVDNGEWVEIPRNSQGEVFDAAGQYCSVIFPMKDPGFPHSVPYPATAQHARAYIEADLLTLVNRGGLSTPLRA